MQYVALLRGINVGGKNSIPMAKLKECFESCGFSNVTTYIQSGNVLFSSSETDISTLTTQVEVMLSAVFPYKARVVVLSHLALRQVVREAPPGFGLSPDLYRYDVIFPKAPLTAAQAMQNMPPPREGVDEVHAGKHAVYFSRLTSRATQSQLSKIITMPMYQHMTIRNWNTTTKLLQLMDASTASK